MKKIILGLLLFLMFSSSVSAAVVNGASINGSTVTGENTLVEGGTHNGENIKNEDCLKYPEKCKASIPDINLESNIDVPEVNLNSAGTQQIQKASKLPRTGTNETVLIFLAILFSSGMFFIVKNKKTI